MKVSGALTTLISSLLFVALLVSTSCDHGDHRHTTRLFVPRDYVGWVRIEYGVQGANPLPNHWRLKPPMLWTRELIPASGLLQTSTPLDQLQTSTLLDQLVAGELYVYDNNGESAATDTKILCHLTSDHNFKFKDPNETRSFVTYFVGPASEEYRCGELDEFKTGTLPPYAARRFSDLPTVGSINVQRSP